MTSARTAWAQLRAAFGVTTAMKDGNTSSGLSSSQQSSRSGVAAVVTNGSSPTILTADSQVCAADASLRSTGRSSRSHLPSSSTHVDLVIGTLSSNYVLPRMISAYLAVKK